MRTARAPTRRCATVGWTPEPRRATAQATAQGIVPAIVQVTGREIARAIVRATVRETVPQAEQATVAVPADRAPAHVT